MKKIKESKVYLLTAIIGFVVTGLPYGVGIWFPFMYGVLALAVISFGVWVYVEKDRILDFFKNRNVHKNSFQFITLLWAFVIVVGLNFIAAKYNKSLDITSDKTNTLSKESIQILKGLKDDISLKVFYTEDSPAALRLSLKKLFHLYEKESSLVMSKFLNAKWEPEAAQYLTGEDKKSISVFVESKKGKEEVSEPISEETITTAIIRLNSNIKNKVYFTAGHGEKSLADPDLGGLSELKAALGARGLVTAPLSLLSLKNGEMPKDLYALVIAGPVKPFVEKEINILRGYLEDGGKLVVAVDPEFMSSLNTIFNSIGVTFKNNYILSAESPLPLITIGSVFAVDSDITKDFKNAQVMFPVSGSISVDYSKVPKGIEIQSLVSTGPYAIAATNNDEVQKTIQTLSDLTNLSSLKNVASYDLAILAKGIKEETHKHLHDGHEHDAQFKEGEAFSFIGFADSDFLSNEYINNVFNKDLIMNSIIFMTGQKDLITIRPNQARTSTIQITSMGLNIGALMSFTPFLFLMGFAIFFWFRKRSM